MPTNNLPPDIEPEDLPELDTGERLDNLLQLLQDGREDARRNHPCRITDILEMFADFLSRKPGPPKTWQDRVGVQAGKFDYHQIVLPGDYLDPYLDDLENVRKLHRQFSDGNCPMVLEHHLLSFNYFLFSDGIYPSIAAPRPLLMLESAPEDPEINWDCALTVFPDGSYYSYNLDKDQEEDLGEDIYDILPARLDLLGKLRLLIPAQGRDFGHLGSQNNEN